jgi:hypothetical protein
MSIENPTLVHFRHFRHFSSLLSNLSSTTVESALQIHLFMQNEPNFRKSQVNVSDLLIREYEQMDTWSIRKNEPKTNPNEPNSNPIQTQTNPISVFNHVKLRNLQRRPVCGNGCKDKNCNSLIDLALHCWYSIAFTI